MLSLMESENRIAESSNLRRVWSIAVTTRSPAFPGLQVTISLKLGSTFQEAKHYGDDLCNNCNAYVITVMLH